MKDNSRNRMEREIYWICKRAAWRALARRRGCGCLVQLVVTASLAAACAGIFWAGR